MTIISFMSLQSSQSKRNNFHSLNFWAWVQKNNRCKKKNLHRLILNLENRRTSQTVFLVF